MIIIKTSFLYLNICRYEKILLKCMRHKNIVSCKVDFFSCKIIIAVINYSKVQEFQLFSTISNQLGFLEN